MGFELWNYCSRCNCHRFDKRSYHLPEQLLITLALVKRTRSTSFNRKASSVFNYLPLTGLTLILVFAAENAVIYRFYCSLADARFVWSNTIFIYIKDTSMLKYHAFFMFGFIKDFFLHFFVNPFSLVWNRNTANPLIYCFETSASSPRWSNAYKLITCFTAKDHRNAVIIISTSLKTDNMVYAELTAVLSGDFVLCNCEWLRCL